MQELFCIETLSMVDILCLDKTGTITEGKMSVAEILPMEGAEEDEVEKLAGRFEERWRITTPPSWRCGSVFPR